MEENNIKKDKQEIINGSYSLIGRFHKNPQYKLLKKIIKKSKDIPHENRENLISLLRKDDITDLFLGDHKKYKYLLATGMFYRAYDIYTTSLIAYHLRNRASIYLLLRAQLENVGKIAYYLIHTQ